MLRDGKGFSNPITLASAATTDIGGQNSQFVEISGTTTITSLGSTYNGPRFLRFTGALTLTNNATTLNIPGAANIVTAAGDMCIAIPNASLNGWNIHYYTRSNGLVPGTAASGANSDITSLSALTTVPSIMPVVNIRQTVMSGPVDTNGFPTFLPATSANLNLTTQNISTGVNALVATAAGGANAGGEINVVGQSVSNLTWTGCTANQINFLPVSIAAGVLTALTPVILPPIYQFGGTPAVTAGQYTYNIQQGIMWLGNGSTASAVNHVILGEAVAGASTITSTIAYAYQGKALKTQSSIAGSTQYALSHNIGTNLVKISPWLENKTAEAAFSVGDRASTFTSGGASGGPVPSHSWDRNTFNFSTGGAIYVIYKNGSSVTPITFANWSFGVLVERGW